VKAVVSAGCEVKVVQSEAPQNGFEESNRRSPVKAASGEVDVGNKEGSMVVDSYVDADNAWVQLADVAVS
jgi:hypothetical protein